MLGTASAHADMTLTGGVVDALTERPIAGARVCVMGEMRGVAQHAITTTDAAGAFVAPLPAAICANAGETGATCGAASSGYLGVRVGISAARYQPVLLAATSAVMQARLLRARTYAVRGIVTDASNTPVCNAHIALIADDKEWRATCRACDVWTDAAGTFEIAHVPVNAGPLALQVQAPGFVTAGGTALRVNPEDGDAFFTVRLNRGCHVVGQVTWDNGEKATNARVWVRAVKPEEVEIDSTILTYAPFEPIDGCVAYTDRTGAFDIATVPYGVRCTVHADAPGGMPDLQVPDATENQNSSAAMDLCLTRGDAWLALTLTNAANTRITNAVVQMVLQHVNSGGGTYFVISSIVLPDQRLLFGPLPAARMQSIEVNAPGYAQFYDRLALAPGATSQMTIALLPVPIRYVQVLDIDSLCPVTNATVELVRLGTRVDRNGFVCLTMPSSRAVTVTAPGYARVHESVDIAEPPCTNIVWLARPFDLTVFVMNAVGTPVTNSRVELATAGLPMPHRFSQWSLIEDLSSNGVAGFRNVPMYSSNFLVTVRNNQWFPLRSQTIKISAPESCAMGIFCPPLCRFSIAMTTDPSNAVASLEGRLNDAAYSMIYFGARDQNKPSTTNFIWHSDWMPIGTYTFRLRLASGVRIYTNVTVSLSTSNLHLFATADEVTRLRIILRPATTNNDIRSVPVSVRKENADPGVLEASYDVCFTNGAYVYACPEPDDRYHIKVDLVTTALVYNSVSARNGPLSVDLPPLYTLRGTVACPDRTNTQSHIVCLGKPSNCRGDYFAIGNVAAGVLPVTIGVAGHSATTFPVTITDQDVELGTIRLTATGASVITGRMLGGTGQHRKIYWCNGLDFQRNVIALADDGTFRTPPLTRGSLVALTLFDRDGNATNIAQVLLTNDVIDLGDLRVE